MTLYSCLPTEGKVTVIATWPGQYADSHSAKVTTLGDAHQASRLADDLTRVSESMWDAAAWLDVYDEAEARLKTIIDATRRTTDIPVFTATVFDGCRHAESWTGTDLINSLGSSLPRALNSLTRAQRLSVADELAEDMEARSEALHLLPTGNDPTDPASRVWQAADITQATKMGLTGPLPDGAAGWMARAFDTDHGPAERWGARNLLHRLEQLAAAAKTVNARGGTDLDSVSGLMDHLVLPATLFGVQLDDTDSARRTVTDDIHPAVAQSLLADAYRDDAANAEFLDGDAVLYIAPNIDMRRTAPWDRDVFAKVQIELSSRRGKVTLATLEATDTQGFVAALGNWVTSVPFRA
ncbi:hypothetical protein DM793_03955 [Paenarthrobacter nitroguajacolicus]|uniref:hypothetical protein n=1 Tax=Paenarthrobacter nitroguajacolicus TaxID=211146 RepID=UPI0015BA51FE|nr:hypothetical protein [Paenarthrobacter nitroguajacolicus]NWL10457.1 hypothetical protein [Paenarthrobacter nitroguajacolicus]